MKAQDFLKTHPVDAEVLRSKISESKEKMRRAELVQQYCSCQVCGGPLELRHRSNYAVFELIESGACQDCGAKVPARLFRIC